MDSSTPFYKYIRQYLYRSIFYASLLISLALALLYFRDQQVKDILENDMTQMSSITKMQETAITINQLILAITTSENTSNFEQLHRAYINQLTVVSTLPISKKRLIKAYVTSEEDRLATIATLSKNAQKNQQAKQSALIQATLVLDQLHLVLREKEAAQASLFDEIMDKKSSSKNMTTRARKYANTTQELDLLRKTALAVENIQVLLSRLTVSYSLEEYQYFSNEMKQVLTLWQEAFDNIDSAEDTPFVSVLNELEKLLYSEHRVIDKWLAHMQSTQQYFERITEQSKQLNLILNQKFIRSRSDALVPEIIRNYIPKQYNVTHQHIRFFVVGVFLFLIFLWWFSASRYVKRIDQKSQKSLSHLKGITEGEVDKKHAYSSYEEKKTAQLFVRVLDGSLEQSLPIKANNKFDVQVFSSVLLSQAKIGYFSIGNEAHEYLNKIAISLLYGKTEDGAVLKHWRHAFSKETVKLICQEAKQAKQVANPRSFDVSTLNNNDFSLTLFFCENTWQGTLVAINEKIKYVEKDTSVSPIMSSNSVEENTDRLSKMLIRTMLQSQSVSIGSGVTSLQVYRQLTRIFDWCRQLQIYQELQEDVEAASLSTVTLRAELFAVAQNALVEANYQRNNIQMNIDDDVAHHSEINVQPFHHMMMGLSRLCLLEAYKSTLNITVSAGEIKENHQCLSFNFNVMSGKKIEALPDAIALLTTKQSLKSQPSLQIIEYMRALLQVMNGKNIDGRITEQGFLLSFDLHIAIKEQRSLTTEKANLQQQLFLLCSQNAYVNNAITQSVIKVQGRVQEANGVDNIYGALTPENIANSPIKAIIISLELYTAEQNKITSTIQALPRKLQPSIYVVQPRFSQKFHKDGFFGQTDFPCELDDFGCDLARFIATEKPMNLLQPASEFTDYRFINTQVEVLVAVTTPQENQYLLRLLAWMGLQATVVCQPSTMLKHWQTGRYLVLLTAFDESPFVEMQVGKNVNRGVFNLGEKLLKLADEALPDYMKNWRTGNIQAVENIKHLVGLFTPWLKEKSHAVTNVSTMKQTTSSDKASQAIKAVQNRNNATDTGENLAPTLNEINVIDKEKAFPIGFDLQGFADNQGSPELAVYMLDDYIRDIGIALPALTQALTAKDFNQSKELILTIINTCKILVADELLNTALECQHAINKQAIPEANANIKRLTQQYQSLIAFAEAI